MNSVLEIVPIVSSAGKGSNTQSDMLLKFKNTKTMKCLTFPKRVGAEIREGEYNFFEFQINPLTAEVFFVFWKETGMERIEFDTTKEKKKFTLRSKTTVEYLAEYLQIQSESAMLCISNNISRTDNCLTYRITKQ